MDLDACTNGLDIIAETRQKINALSDLERYLLDDIETLTSSQRSLLTKDSIANTIYTSRPGVDTHKINLFNYKKCESCQNDSSGQGQEIHREYIHMAPILTPRWTFVKYLTIFVFSPIYFRSKFRFFLPPKISSITKNIYTAKRVVFCGFADKLFYKNTDSQSFG